MSYMHFALENSPNKKFVVHGTLTLAYIHE
jgi:hypothetical protein